MDIARIVGTTRTLGGGQGFLPLHIRDERTTDGAWQLMVSEWAPSTEERAALVSGASVFLTVVGTMHPPVMLDVGNAPEAPAAATMEAA